MSDMVENGSSGGAGPLEPSESHNEFLELCAIATSGSLSAAERSRLAKHLSECADCRAVMAQYEVLVGRIIPAMDSETSSADAHGPSDWSLEQAEATLFARLDSDRERRKDRPSGESETSRPTATIPSGPAGDLLWQHVWWQFAAGIVLLAALGFSLYRVGRQHGVESARPASAILSPAPSAVQSVRSEAEINVPPREVEDGQKDTQVAALRSQLALKSELIARLTAQQAELEKDLTDKDSEQTRLAQEKTNLAQQLELAQTNLQTIQQKLDADTAQGAANAAQVAALREKVNELTNSMHERDQELAQEQQLLDHDRDIRELMGSRDLYIAEVYDVAKTGDTQKPFGRVFYTKGKSLVFYAYDLDQQPGLRNASTFQAWGRRGPDPDHAVNLGIFYQDNANKKRWVLKSTDPKTLAQIDAVFVTVEPHGGSSHPSGNPLLFAYLRIEPNHP